MEDTPHFASSRTARIEIRREVHFPPRPFPPGNDDTQYALDNIKIKWEPMEELLGYRADEVEETYSWWKDRIHPDDLEWLEKEMRAHGERFENTCCAQARLWNGVYRFRKRDGTYLQMRDRLNTVRRDGWPHWSESYMYAWGDDQRTGKYVGDGNDFQIVCGNMHSAIFMMNASGYVTFMNAAAERLTGFRFEEIKNVTFHEAVHSLHPDGSAYSIKDCPIYAAQCNNETLADMSEVFVDKSGRFFPILFSVAPLHGGYEHGAVIEFRDVSHLQRVEEERMKALRQNEQKTAKIKQDEVLREKISAFTDFLCHEVRNPLHGIAANKTFLQEAMTQLEDTLHISSRPTTPSLSRRNSQDGVKGATEVAVNDSIRTLLSSMRGYLTAIEDCAAHQGNILNSVLDLSRLEMGALKLISEPFSPWDIVQKAIKMCRAQAEAKRVKIALEGDWDTQQAVVRGDPTPVRQIYLNLISNATKFSHPDTTVTATMNIRHIDHEPYMTLKGSVRDQGVGMTQTEVGKLFQRFAQANRHVSEVYGGSGLGLSISKELVKLMKGELSVKSEKGKGSEFFFYVKVDSVSDDDAEAFRSSHVPPGTPKADAGSKRRVLVNSVAKRRFTHILAAEDNVLNRKILAKYLQNVPNLKLVNDGQQAVDYFREHALDIDLIIMDQNMPVLDGKDATRLIRAHEKELELEFRKGRKGDERKKREWRFRVPIVALSGNVRSEQVAEAKEAGMDDHLGKPCSRQSLDEMLSKWEKLVYEEELAGK